jgi:hypothetical protein
MGMQKIISLTLNCNGGMQGCQIGNAYHTGHTDVKEHGCCNLISPVDRNQQESFHIENFVCEHASARYG